MTGTFVISIDAELGWGFHDLARPPASRVEAGPDGWEMLLDIFEKHDVPATWAIVGHLLLDSCDRTHANHPSIDGWFRQERESWCERRDLRFAPDLVEHTIESGPDHEIACHTFSHVLFDDPRVTREIANAEVTAAVEAGNRFGITYDSFVFPRNAVGHRDVLAEHGFTSYRSAAPVPGSRVQRAAEKFASAVVARPPLVEPTVDEHGMVDIPPSLFLFGFEGTPRTLAASVGVDPIVRQAKRGIDRATRADGVFHVWLHPNNIRTERDARRLESIIAYAADRRDDTELTIKTMADVAATTRTRAPTPVSST